MTIDLALQLPELVQPIFSMVPQYGLHVYFVKRVAASWVGDEGFRFCMDMATCAALQHIICDGARAHNTMQYSAAHAEHVTLAVQ